MCDADRPRSRSPVRFRQGIKDFGVMKYVMALAPDNVLLEVFETKGL